MPDAVRGPFAPHTHRRWRGLLLAPLLATALLVPGAADARGAAAAVPVGTPTHRIPDSVAASSPVTANTLRVEPAVAAVGETVRVRGRTPVAGRGATLVLQRRDRATGTWRTVVRVRADRYGYFVVPLPAGSPGRTTLRVASLRPAPAFTLPLASMTTVRPALVLVATVRADAVDAVASVTPARSGRPVLLQLRSGDTWRTVASGRTTTSGAVRLTWSRPPSGLLRLRASVSGVGTPAVLTSAWQRVTVAPTATPAPTPTPPVTSAPTKDVVGVLSAGGQRQYVDCRGAGAPTLVLVAGRYGWSKDWVDQVGALRTRSRVCVYDRPGLGASPPRTGATAVDAGLHARELAALLTAAGEPGPFVVVGHSYGGLIARAFRSAFPARVVGVGLLDAVPAYWQDIAPGYSAQRDEAGSMIDMVRSSQAAGGVGPLADVPLLVVTAGYSQWGEPAWVQTRWEAEQHALAVASRDALELLALRAGHQLQVYAPQVTLQSLVTLVDAAAGRGGLPGCPGDWAALGAQCVSSR